MTVAMTFMESLLLFIKEYLEDMKLKREEAIIAQVSDDKRKAYFQLKYAHMMADFKQGDCE